MNWYVDWFVSVNCWDLTDGRVEGGNVITYPRGRTMYLVNPHLNNVAYFDARQSTFYHQSVWFYNGHCSSNLEISEILSPSTKEGKTRLWNYIAIFIVFLETLF